MRINNSGSRDVRRLFSGKDGAIFSEDGELLATITAWQAQCSFTNANYQPLGDAQVHQHMTSYEVSLTITEAVIETSRFVQDVYNWALEGYVVNWTFRGQIVGWKGSAESVVFRDCTPSGQIDLQNMQPGDLMQRSWNLHVNGKVELQTLLKSEDWRD